MWLDYIWDIPLFWWFLLTAFMMVIIVSFIRRKPEKDPSKTQMDHFCRCYARGEISLDDFRELKHDLEEFEKKSIPEKQDTPEPVIHKNDMNNKQPRR